MVVIVYNDADRLDTAVRSVRRQTMTDLEIVIIDDASTDATPTVTAKLAAADPRIRVERLAENSGGCSRPRNAGIDIARGRYVMFLDSDDELPRTACATLVAAAEADEADFSSGLCHRVHLSKGGAVSPWYRWLYTRRTTYESILENPDLLYDTLSTNKCYRRDFLQRNALRFPEGVHYEDLLFSGEVYLLARRFTLVPDVVYRWNVVESLDTPSISNRRSELRNFEDRVRVHRLLDEQFRAHGATQLKLHKDLKFLRHDLVLYLPDLPFRDSAFREEFGRVARSYLETLDAAAFARVHPLQALVGWYLLHDDEAGLFGAIDYVAHGRKLSTRLLERSGRVFWDERGLEAAADAPFFDVTELGFQELALPSLDLYDEVTQLQVHGHRLELRGRLLNQLGRIPSEAPVAARLIARPRRGRRSGSVPVLDLRREPDTGDIEWTATVDTRQTIRALGFVDRVWDLRLQLSVGSEVNESRLTVRNADWDGLHLSGRPLAGRFAADRLQTLVTPQGDLALEWVPGTRSAQAVHKAGQRVLRSPGLRRARQTARRAATLARHPAHPRVREEVLARALRPARTRPRSVVFQSEDGAAFGGSPRAVFDELRRRRLPIEPIWVHAGDTTVFPTDVRLVRHGSWAYYSALARAEAWVDDSGFPRETVKSPSTVYVHIPRFTPLRWVGFDAPQMRRASNDDRLALRRSVDRWDAVCVRAPYDEDVLARAFRHTAQTLPVGLPRNDALVHDDAASVHAARAAVGVRPEDLAVLHLRDCDRPAEVGSAVAFGGARVLRLGDGPLEQLLLAADVLVTDHHPAMFDIVLRDRPVILVGCRCEIGRTVHGTAPPAYVDIAEAAPGPVVHDDEALAALLADLERTRHDSASLRAAARVRFAEYDQGRAAAAVADFLVERCAGLRAACDEVGA
ncbi:MAG TPA: CDP-glycerol glycerophosphotransferase family protein [Mycobacteriales bacterium]|nr:CDP-glycerol glycerophosphotransferase family protein [Mycobacteriales bacterium]